MDGKRVCPENREILQPR